MKKYWHLTTSRRKILSILLVIVPPVSVFFMLRSFLLDQILELALVNKNAVLFSKGVYLVALALSALFGSFILQKIHRKQFYILTLCYRIMAIVSILGFQSGNGVLIPCFLLGSSFGLGFPSDLSFLSDNTEIDERGKVSGITLCLTFVTVLLLMIVTSGYDFSIAQNTLIVLILQSLSGVNLIINSSWEAPPRLRVPFSSVMENRTFVLYLVPWGMFSLVNGAVIFLWDMVIASQIAAIAIIAKYFASIIFFIIAGIVCDYFGRKIALLIGFVMLGFSYFLFPSISFPAIDLTVSIFTGVAWSFIMVSFLFTIVGDLSPEGGREVFFAISGLLWLVIETGFTFISSVVTLDYPISIVSSILSLIMFITVIPLLSVPETLPQIKIADRRISDYFERVLKTLEEKKD